MSKYIAAFTEENDYKNYPAYINVSKNNDGIIEITVRERDSQDVSVIHMTEQQFKNFTNEISEVNL